MRDIFTKVVDLPCDVKAFTITSEQDDYIVVLNARLTDVAQREGFVHEVKHIIEKDFEKQNVSEVEMIAHLCY